MQSGCKTWIAASQESVAITVAHWKLRQQRLKIENLDLDNTCTSYDPYLLAEKAKWFISA